MADARAAADRAAGSYLELLTRSETLDAEMRATEQQLEEMGARLEELRATLRGRAATAYIRSGSTDIEFGLGSDEAALEVARRSALLNRLNESDNEVAEQLADLTEALEAKRAKLQADRAAYEETLTLLRDEQAQLDAKLAKAQAARNTALAKAQPAPAPAPGAPAAPTTTPAPVAAPAAPTPPASYTPTPGEHPQHWDPFLTCTRTVESGGNYQAYNPQGPWYGAYQFLQSTWNSAANHANRPELIGLDPRLASEYDQDDMAWTLYQWQGKGPWGDRC
ncbi:MAG: transglycosylase family protein [Actinomycetota bacterium]